MSYHHPKPHAFKSGPRPLSARSLNLLTEGIKSQQRGVQGVSVQDYGDKQTIGLRLPCPILPSPSNYLQQFVVLQEYDDLLYCAPVLLPIVNGLAMPFSFGTTPIDDGTQLPTPARYWIAKPYHLQRSPWDGQIIPNSNSTAMIGYFPPPSNQAARKTYNTRFLIPTGGKTGNAQTYPAYMPGEVITAVKTLMGYHEPVDVEFEKLTETPSVDITTQDLLNAETIGTQEPVVWMDVNCAGRTWPSTTVAVSRNSIPTGSESILNGVFYPKFNSHLVPPLTYDPLNFWQASVPNHAGLNAFVVSAGLAGYYHVDFIVYYSVNSLSNLNTYTLSAAGCLVHNADTNSFSDVGENRRIMSRADNNMIAGIVDPNFGLTLSGSFDVSLSDGSWVAPYVWSEGDYDGDSGSGNLNLNSVSALFYMHRFGQ